MQHFLLYSAAVPQQLTSPATCDQTPSPPSAAACLLLM